jgi:multidrug efflux pump subunit AcrA (membrane-fusion protein)
MTGEATRPLAEGPAGAEAGPEAGPGAGADPWARLRAPATQVEGAQAWLQLMAAQLPGLRTGVVILGRPDRGGFAPVAVHPPGTLVGPDLARTAEAALGEGRGVRRERAAGPRDEGLCALAYPVTVDGRVEGVVAVDLAPPAGDPGAAEALGRRLQWGVAWIEILVRRRTAVPPRRLAEAMDLGAALAEAPRLRPGLQALATDLAGMMGAEWAAVGLLRADGTVRDLAALSHLPTPSRRQELVRAIAAAMQEAADQRDLLLCPAPPDAAPAILRAHDRLAEVAGPGAHLSVPLAAAGGAGVAVLTLRRAADRPWAGDEAEFLRLTATWLGPIVALRQRDDLSPPARAGVALRDALALLVGPRRLGLKLAAVAVLGLAAVLAAVEAPDRVTAPATLEGRVQRAVTAPVAGFLEAALVRAGDVVAEGEVLARLDRRELEVERVRWLAERDRFGREYQRAFAAGERAELAVLRARIDEAQARLDLVEEMLARVEIRSPIAGHVIAGDLDQMLGAPVQRGDVLYTVAPLGGYRVALRVDERDIARLAAGQAGNLVLSGLADVALPLTVARITPVSVARDGRNLFRVEARLEAPDDLLRPGMEGWAKVEVGRRPLWQLATGRAGEWLRVAWWRWAP